MLRTRCIWWVWVLLFLDDWRFCVGVVWFVSPMGGRVEKGGLGRGWIWGFEELPGPYDGALGEMEEGEGVLCVVISG